MQPLDQTFQLRNTSSPHFQYTCMEITARKVTSSVDFGADVAVTERIGNQLALASWTFLVQATVTASRSRDNNQNNDR